MYYLWLLTYSHEGKKRVISESHLEVMFLSRSFLLLTPEVSVASRKTNNKHIIKTCLAWGSIPFLAWAGI